MNFQCPVRKVSCPCIYDSRRQLNIGYKKMRRRRKNFAAAAKMSFRSCSPANSSRRFIFFLTHWQSTYMYRAEK